MSAQPLSWAPGHTTGQIPVFMDKYLKKKKIRFNKDIEPQEIFLDYLAQKKETELGISERKLEVPLSKRILRGFLIFITILILAFLVKTFHLQVLEHKKFLALAQEKKFIIHSIQSSRGVIYDSKGKQLVFNKPSYDLFFDKRKSSQFNSKDLNSEEAQNNNISDGIKDISKIIKENPEDLEKKISLDNNQIVLISENLDYQTLILIEARIADFPAFLIKKNAVRDYKNGKSFAHIIGYTGKISDEEMKKYPEFYTNYDYVGRTGIESFYEEVLRKNSGKLQIEKDAFGNQMSKKVISLPESGKSLSLWLDSELQEKIEQELEKTLRNIGAKKASAVALNPKTGGVMALVNLPGFDNNLFNKGADPESLKNLLEDKNKEEYFFNRAIAGQYSTGSTIKPLIALAALEEKIISPLKKIICQGKIVIPHPYDPESCTEKHDWMVHGSTDMRKAIAESCNVYFYTIGGGYRDQKGLGPSMIKKYLELFGWGNQTRIDLPGESRGLIPCPEWKKEVKKENWWDGDTYNLSIGQGDVLATPLQVAVAFAAIANKGTLYKPKIVRQIVDKEKNLIEEIKPEVLRQNFIDSENLKIVREGMRQTVSGEESPHATAILLNYLPVKAAAKTGSAQTPKPNHYHNWITIFAPYENPEIVLTLIIENVKDIQGSVLPVAKEVLNWYFTR